MHAAGIHFLCLRYFRPEDVEPGVGGDLRCEDVAPHRSYEEGALESNEGTALKFMAGNAADLFRKLRQCLRQ